MTEKTHFICPLCFMVVLKAEYDEHRLRYCSHPSRILPDKIEEAKERFSRVGLWEEIDQAN
jgi:hypothetical protein